MEATGVVRKVDNLGRIVIPKEILKMFHLEQGDSFELFIENDGRIVLKKYSAPVKRMKYVQNYAEMIYQSLGHTTIVCDKDKVVAISGGSKANYFNKKISDVVRDGMKKRISVVGGAENEISFIEGKQESGISYLIEPINVNGDVLGAIIIFSGNQEINEIEQRIVKITSELLGCQI